MKRITHQTFLVLGLLVTWSCQSNRGATVWLPPTKALSNAPSASNAIEQFDLTAVMGNNYAQARSEINAALKESPDHAALWFRSAYLNSLQLKTEAWLHDSLRGIALAPDTAASHYALHRISERLPDLLNLSPQILKVLQPTLLRAKNPTTIALASRLVFTVQNHHEKKPESAETIKRGGWLNQNTVLGPIGPYLFHSLNHTNLISDRKPLKPSQFAGRPLTPKRNPENGTSLPISRRSSAGLYASDSYFKLPGQQTDHEIDLQVQSRARYRVAIDGVEVINRASNSPLKGRYQYVRLKLSPGWHQIRILALASARQVINVSILGADAQPIVSEQSSAPKPVPSNAKLEIVGTWPYLESGVAPGSIEAHHSKFDHLLAAMNALTPWSKDIDRARHLLRPIEMPAKESGLYHLIAAALLRAEESSEGDQLVHLRKAQTLAPNCPEYLFQIAKRMISEKPEEAMELANQIHNLGGDQTKVELIRYSVFKGRDWLVDADNSYEKLLESWQATDILHSILGYFRDRKYELKSKALENRILKQSGKQRTKTETNFDIYAGRSKKIETAYIKAREDESGRAQDTLRLANYYLEHNELEKALALATEVLKAYPQSKASHRIKISALHALRQETKLKEVLNEATQVFSSSLDFEEFIAEKEDRLPGLPPKGSKLDELLTIDPLTIAKTPLETRWAKHGKVRLLDRHIDYLRDDGHVLSMTHFLTRITTKEAADQVGEIGLGQGVIPLELRTLKPDGRIIDVEKHKGKKDLSYAALAPGDTIENQTVTINAPRTRRGGYQQIFYFQDTAPNLRGEFFLVVRKGTQVNYQSYHGAPKAEVFQDGDHEIYLWKSPALEGVIPEPFSVPSKEFIPFVVVSVGISPEDARLENGSVFDGAYESGYDIIQKAESLVSQSTNNEEKVKTLFRWILKEIKPSSTFSPIETLRNKRGNRIGLLKAMLEAVGVKVDLILARSNQNFILNPPYPDSKRHGIVALRVETTPEPIWIRTSSKLNWLGKVQPDFQGSTYLRVGAATFKEEQFEAKEIADWKPKSKLSLVIDKDYVGKGDLEITFPAAVGQSLRASIESIPDKDRLKILSRWIGGIIRGFDVTGAKFLTPKDPLVDPVLHIDVVAYNLVQASGSRLLMPKFFGNFIATQMLGIPKLSEYIKLSERKTPMLFRGINEDMVVEVRFEGLLGKPILTPKSWTRDSNWGRYEQTFEWSKEKQQARLRRSVSMPAGRVLPGEYEDFLDLVRELRLRARNQLLISKD